MIETDDYKRGWYDGYQAAKKEQQINYPAIPLPNVNSIPNRCSVCGIEWGSGAWGYVCTYPKCPSGVPYSNANPLYNGKINER